jgi:BirA family biotin operon repressor/biotin-[acetyl-CoA-carboxylase] ligase
MMMKTKTHILALLESGRDRHISGESIAAELNISRNAVWKAIKELQKSGHEIEAVTNKGYRLSENSDILSVQGILPFLLDKSIVKQIYVHDVLESTNKTAKEMAVSDIQSPAVIIADSQSAGKGRYGRAFHSPPASGLYMSFILQSSQLRFSTPTLITAFAAVCVCEAIEEVSREKPQIKWVNDIFIDKSTGEDGSPTAYRKVCGILTEAVTDFESGSTGWVVVGIGVNFKDSGFPDDLKQVAGAVFDSSNPPVTRNRLCAGIINRMINPEADEKAMLKKYKSRMFMLGKTITVSSMNTAESYEAVALDVDQIGRLAIKKADGETLLLTAGEISIKI